MLDIMYYQCLLRTGFFNKTFAHTYILTKTGIMRYVCTKTPTIM